MLKLEKTIKMLILFLLVMHFQDIYPPNNWLKITPTNFLPDMELDYVLTLTIENLSIMRARPLMGRARTQVGVTLNAENNSLNCHGGKFPEKQITSQTH